MADIWILDWKSSTGVWDEMLTQVCAYWGMELTIRAQRFDLGEPMRRVGVLRLDKESGILDDPPIKEVPQEEIGSRWNAFIHLREYYHHIIEPTLTDKKKERWYPYEGKKFPTITTILDILNKPALVQWSANLTVQYIEAHLGEMNNEKAIEYHLKKAKTAYREISKKAMDTGSVVHDAIHAHLSGVKPDDILKGSDRAENAFLAFLEWADKVKMKPIALEKVLIDPVHEIGGTCDFIGELISP